MREETPIVGAASSKTDGILTHTLAGPQKASIVSGRFRWVICGLLFLGVTKNYIDRQVLIAASAYLTALLLIHTLSLRLEPAVIGRG
jgi:hypothetical protein